MFLIRINQIEFGGFYFSTYFLIILFAFVIAFPVLYRFMKAKYDIVDITYCYVLNILGIAIGSKLFYLIDTSRLITIEQFLYSGYSFVGGVLGSVLTVFLYCKKYKLKYADVIGSFMVVYPLIYSVGKVACFVNGCCGSAVLHIPLQLAEALSMLGLFVYLFFVRKTQNSNLVIQNYFIMFGILRFTADYFRNVRYERIFGVTLSQMICLIFILLGVIKIIYNKEEKQNEW